MNRRDNSQGGVSHHRFLTQNGWEILKKYALLPGRKKKKIGLLGKYRLKKAISLFNAALIIAPNDYNLKWALGKSYQAIGDNRVSLKWFEEAWELEKQTVDICREASLSAMGCGEYTKALSFCDKAIDISPREAGLFCNKALALMFMERDAEAIEAIVNSLSLCPNDPITLHVRHLLHSVIDGKSPRPKFLKDIS